MYHCVLLFLSPLDAGGPVPFAEGFPEGVMVRPPTTLVYAGSELYQHRLQ
jgi:hypothetical protein